MSSQAFTYLPLRNAASIRVLLLEPARDYDAPLFASLQHVQITKPDPTGPLSRHATAIAMASSTSLLDTTQVEYEAISYAWGGQAPTAQLGVSGTAPPEHFNISPTVDIMLRHLRLLTKLRVVWIDAICIDQNNLDEKGGQVKFMGEIYRQAKAIVVWVGPPADAHSNVTQFFEDLVKYSRVDSRREEERAATWEMLRTFLERLWFKRRWTIQEVVLAKQAVLLCGKHMINFMVFVKHASQMAQQHSYLKPTLAGTLRKLGMMYKLRSRHALEAGPEPLSLLLEFSAAECTDEHDRIYALSALADMQIPVSYTKSVEEVFVMFAETYVQASNLAILNFAGAFRLSGQTRPSWVPDWRVPPAYTPLATQLVSQTQSIFEMKSQDGTQCQSAQAISSPVLNGIKFGTVSRVGTKAPFPTRSGDLLQLLQDWYSTFETTASRSSHRSQTDNVLGDQFISTMSLGAVAVRSNVLSPDHPWLRNAHLEHTPGVSSTLALLIREAREMNSVSQWTNEREASTTAKYQVTASEISSNLKNLLSALTYSSRGSKEDLASSWNSEDDDAVGNDVPGRPVPADHLVHILCQSTGGRTCFWTKEGSFGLGPASMEPGDVVVAVPACPIPYVLRSKLRKAAEESKSSKNWLKKLGRHTYESASEEFYTLVGDCHLHGFEADALSDRGKELRNFTIT